MLLLVRAHVEGMLASVLVILVYDATKPAQELRASLNLDLCSFVEALLKQAPLAPNIVKIGRVLREALNDRAASSAQGSDVAMLPQTAKVKSELRSGDMDMETSKSDPPPGKLKVSFLDAPL